MKPSSIEAPHALLADPPEVVVVDTTRVSCEGVGGTLGHPRVFMEMGDSGFVECGYCDRRFVLGGGRAHEPAEVNAPASQAYEDH
ncbi:MAG: zinc-finger domain-containing protein [Pseudomonadota bacterium]|nr:zinc-finger domain-containing protein [Pseudomonadota bacterium]